MDNEDNQIENQIDLDQEEKEKLEKEFEKKKLDLIRKKMDELAPKKKPVKEEQDKEDKEPEAESESQPDFDDPLFSNEYYEAPKLNYNQLQNQEEEKQETPSPRIIPPYQGLAEEQENDSPYYEEETERIGTPEEEIGLWYNWTIPKGTHLLTKDKKLGFKEAINQDIVTGFYGPNTEKLLLEHLSLASDLLEFSRQTGINLSGAQRHCVMQISGMVNTSKGAQGNLLKVIKTAYTVMEQKNNQEQEPVKKGKDPNMEFTSAQ